MSSTGRGTVRNESDFYATPKDAFEPLIPFIAQVSANVWEPACGDGRLIKWMNESGKILADGSDINAKINPTNFLTDRQYRECIVTNPPFSLAFNFCQHGFQFSEHMFLLLRLNFLASKKRKLWFQEHEPDALFILSDRPSFVFACLCLDENCQHRWMVASDQDRPKDCPRCGFTQIRVTTSDSCEYCWAYWGSCHNGIFHL